MAGQPNPLFVGGSTSGQGWLTSHDIFFDPKRVLKGFFFPGVSLPYFLPGGSFFFLRKGGSWQAKGF